MRSSVRSCKASRALLPNDFCRDSKECTCVLCYFKYTHRMWFASQTRLLEMYAPKDKELFTKSLSDKFAANAVEASACRDKFILAHGIVFENKMTQKRRAWSLSGSSARAFGTIEDLIYMWYNMDMSLPEESYRHASTHAPERHHPLPYLPESLRVKLYPSLAANTSEIRQMARFLGTMPPHPKITTEIDGRQAQLSVSYKIQSQNCRRVAIEVWRKYLDEKKSARLGPQDMKSDDLRQILSSLQIEVLPEYMRPQQVKLSNPEENLRDTSIRAHDLDYGNHDADPGPYKTKKAISGTVTSKALIHLFQKAEMDSETVFLDIGSGMGEPIIAAARGFQVQLSLGLEVHKNRVEESLRCIIEQGVSRAFPLHVGVEEICHFDPVTHVYCYTNGMDSCTRNCIRESILSSKSVHFVMTDRKDLLWYDCSEPSAFEQVDVVPMSMAGSKYKRHFYILKRKRYRISRDLSAKSDVSFHPIFALPIYMLRFDKAQEQAFLIEYVYMLARAEYKPLHFCAMKQSPQIDQAPVENKNGLNLSDAAARTECRAARSTSKRKRNTAMPSIMRLSTHEAPTDAGVVSVPRRRLQRRRKSNRLSAIERLR